MSMQNSDKQVVAPPRNLMSLFWEKTAIVFLLYWLLHWIKPTLLPEAIRDIGAKGALAISVVPGMAWAIISILINPDGGSAFSRKNARPSPQWPCPKCGCYNEQGLSSCRQCSTPRPEQDSVSLSSTEDVSGK